MRKDKLSLLKVVWTFGFIGFLTVFSYFRILPGLFPSQRPVDPDIITGEFDAKNTVGEYLGNRVISYNTGSMSLARVLGANDSLKRIEVDLTNQKLYAYEDQTKVYDFLISSGKWYPTPTGTFHIWGKFKYTKMSGGNPLSRTYYYLPNVPYVMFFSNDKVAASRGFSLHGTYWHNNFGHPMSHGCVNMKNDEAEMLYYWSQPSTGDKKSIRASEDDPGTEVVIYGEAPKE